MFINFLSSHLLKVFGVVVMCTLTSIIVYLWHYKPIKVLKTGLKDSKNTIEVLERNVSNQIILNSINTIEMHGNVSKIEYIEDLKEFEDESNITSNINTDIGTHTIRL